MSTVAERSPKAATAEHLYVIMAALWNREGNYIFARDFYLFLLLYGRPM